MEGIYEVRNWNGLRWYDTHIKFHDDRLGHLSKITIITETIWDAVILVLLMARIFYVRRWDGFMWHNK
jgi:hypothetical protein